MVKSILYITIISIFFSDWLVFKLDIGIRYITWLPEMFSVILIVYIAFATATTRKFNMGIKYLIVLILYIVHVFSGMVLNQVPSGVVFAGMRYYLKYLPFFLLPAVYEFNEKEIKNLVKLLFFLTLLQCPVALYQRFVSFAGVMSGDDVGGTLGQYTSSILSILMLCAGAFLVAHYLRNRINIIWFILSLGILLIPTTLNETKGTFFLLPIIFIFPFLFSAKDRFRIRKLVPVIMLLIMAYAGWLFVFDYFQDQRWGFGMEEFLAGNKKINIQEYSKARTLPMVKAYNFVSQDISFFVFGVGAGNASGSFRKDMTGEYAKKYAKLGTTTTGITNVIWELGFGGVFILSILFAMLFFDAIRYSPLSNYLGIVSLSMISVVAIFSVSFFYKVILEQNVLTYPFFFFSGLLAGGKYYSKKWESS